ncbi:MULTISPECIES: glucuronate isomerase [unclassified Microbacterium]|uniref:glucuronate isomerase n=1 Tax=unclassified Microbacterium TaxID=2609290 RepID=UPI002804FC23|nr:glucuronate isomerase [Microbacterium sp. zg.B185]
MSSRLFPAEPRVRDLTRGIYALTAALPIISPHGHVSPTLFIENRAFPDPVAMFIRDDHYVTRLMHADGVSLDAFGFDDPNAGADPRDLWRMFCQRWHVFAGTASGYWLRSTLTDVLGIDRPISRETADLLFDEISHALSEPEMRPLALLERFRIDVLATTDDPLDSLAEHCRLAEDSTITTVIRPTFRPDAYIDPAHPHWRTRVAALLEEAGESGFDGYLRALAAQRVRFVNAGATSADFGVVSPDTTPLSATEAASLFERARNGDASAADATSFLAHMLFESARMSAVDGLVMTIHAGVLRNHHAPSFAAYGSDRGHDIPAPTTFAQGLRPLLDEFGTAPGFQLILFTVDETTYSREIAPLAGFYPSVYIGAPWWFLDAPESAQRFRAATVETAGFYRGSGFVDDTRAFLSIPARHDMARRVDAGFLARMVADERLSLDEAEAIAVDLTDAIPRRAFKL